MRGLCGSGACFITSSFVPPSLLVSIGFLGRTGELSDSLLKKRMAFLRSKEIQEGKLIAELCKRKFFGGELESFIEIRGVLWGGGVTLFILERNPSFFFLFILYFLVRTVVLPSDGRASLLFCDGIGSLFF